MSRLKRLTAIIMAPVLGCTVLAAPGVAANPHYIPVQLRIIPGDAHVCGTFRGVDEEPTLGQVLE